MANVPYAISLAERKFKRRRKRLLKRVAERLMMIRLFSILARSYRAALRPKRKDRRSFLTEPQWALLENVSLEWINNALRNKEFNKDLIQDTIAWFYQEHGFPIPAIHYAEGPQAAQELAIYLRHKSRPWRNLNHLMFNGLTHDLNIERQLFTVAAGGISIAMRNETWRSVNTITMLTQEIESALKRIFGYRPEPFGRDCRAVQWSIFYDFFCRAGLMKRSESFERYTHFIRDSGIFLSIYEKGNVILCRNPSVFSMSQQNIFHDSEQKAVSWADGFGLYYIDGSSIPEPLFHSDYRQELTLLLREANAERRRKIVQRLGIDEVINGLGAITEDRWGYYELLRIEIPNMRTTPKYLKMLNPSTKGWHFEGVPASVATVRDALAWRDEEKYYIMPQQLT